MLKHTFCESNPGISNSKICKQCHTTLIRHSLVTCSLCKKDIKHYNALIWKNAQQLPIEEPVSCGPNKQWTCKPCHSTLVDEIICVSCDKKCPKHKTIRYRESKYDMTDNLVQTTLCGAANGSDYICSDCDRKLTATNVCTCCHGKFNLYRVTLFQVQNYDFENYIVSRALGHRFVHGDTEHICKTCDQNLKSSNDHVPRMPWKAVAKKTTLQGAKFLQAMCEKPEFVCTCCHRWLFHQSIMPFDEGKYNMSNDIVKETLGVKYWHPMHVIIFKGTHSAHEHPIDYGDSDCESDSESDVNMPYAQQSITDQNTTVVTKYEYICITCHNSLKRKIPKMPAHACANGLALPVIPPELQNLSDSEWRIIALRIPFMVTFCLVKYGSQYKIRGGCTNVPASLDHVVNMLPRMSSEVQYHPMKLKKIYKSNYMYNYIRKDVVAAAIKWLKENNKLYGGVELNDSWADDWLNSEYSSFLNETDYDCVYVNNNSSDDNPIERNDESSVVGDIENGTCE